MVRDVAARKRPLQAIGDLEMALLELLWSAGEADVHGAHAAVGRRRGITPNTVGSALERLYRKGLAAREKVSHAYRYRPDLSREAFAARRMLDAVGGSQTLAEAGLLAAFVDLVANVDAGSLDRLEDLIAERRGRRGRR